MKLSGEFFLIWRYLKPKANVTSALTYISSLGPMIGVGILLVVISIMNGFPQEIRRKIIDTGSHISITKEANPNIKRAQEAYFDDYEEVLERLEKKYDIKGSPFTKLPVFIQQDGDKITPYFAKGILPENEQKTGKLSTYIKQGSYSLEPNEVIISTDLQQLLRVSVGDTIIVHSPQKYGKMLTQDEDGKPNNIALNVAKELTVSGVYEFGIKTVDIYMFMHLDTANELINLEWGQSQGIDFAIKNPDLALEKLYEIYYGTTNTQANQRLLKRQEPLLDNTKPLTWKQGEHRVFLDLVEREKTMMFLVLFFIVIGTSVGVAASLFTLVLQKTREIGILKALGVSPLSILFIFMFQGCFIGIISTGLGLVGGYITLLNRLSIADMLGYWNQDLHILKDVPMEIMSQDVNIIAWGSIIICTLAALFPALVAVSVNPVKAIQSND